MTADLRNEIEALRSASIGAIRVRYREVFREEPRSKHREHLFRRLAWRLQSLAAGGLSERARHRALEIANEADLRVLPPGGVNESSILEQERFRIDRRIPRPGSMLTREYRGVTVSVKVLPNGFEYGGQRYRSLSAIANEVTGTRWNGLAFFHLRGRPLPRRGSHGNSQR